MMQSIETQRNYFRNWIAAKRVVDPDYGQTIPTHEQNHFRHHVRVCRSLGITPELVQQVFISQGSCCAICKTTTPEGPWHLDHDHVTNKFRGILCRLCNLGLGQFRDSPAHLQAAIEYLKGI
jgi:hypothetical protein